MVDVASVHGSLRDVDHLGGGAVVDVGEAQRDGVEVVDTAVVDVAAPSDRQVHALGDGAVEAVNVVGVTKIHTGGAAVAGDGDIVEGPDMAEAGAAAAAVGADADFDGGSGGKLDGHGVAGILGGGLVVLHIDTHHVDGARIPLAVNLIVDVAGVVVVHIALVEVDVDNLGVRTVLLSGELDVGVDEAGFGIVLAKTHEHEAVLLVGATHGIDNAADAPAGAVVIGAKVRKVDRVVGLEVGGVGIAVPDSVVTGLGLGIAANRLAIEDVVGSQLAGGAVENAVHVVLGEGEALDSVHSVVFGEDGSLVVDVSGTESAVGILCGILLHHVVDACGLCKGERGAQCKTQNQ